MKSFILIVFFYLISPADGEGFNDCKQFFDYGYIPSSDDNDCTEICQDKNGKVDSLFATLYDTDLKIPVYSAYNLIKNDGKGRGGYWYTEHDIDDDEQALNAEYKRIGYDRGHLCPSQYFETEARPITNVLTNAVPQKPKFNQIAWKNLETYSRSLMDNKCQNGKNFFITGAIPGKISTPTGINIPLYMYTAACCRLQGSSFSFGYIGKNGDEPFEVDVIDVTELANIVEKLYKAAYITNSPFKYPFRIPLKFFNDDCNAGDSGVKDDLKSEWGEWLKKRYAKNKNKKSKKTSIENENK